jgi:hypothetical protein
MRASLSWRSAPAATGISARAMSRNTAAGRSALAFGQGRTTRRAQVEMVKSPAVRRQPRYDLAQTGQTRPLRKQHTLQMALAGRGAIAAAHPTIAGMHGDSASDNAPIQQFQQLVNCGTKMGHGRPQNPVWRHDSGPRSRGCLPCKRSSAKIPDSSGAACRAVPHRSPEIPRQSRLTSSPPCESTTAWAGGST